jgi:hypothetical protein
VGLCSHVSGGDRHLECQVGSSVGPGPWGRGCMCRSHPCHSAGWSAPSSSLRTVISTLPRSAFETGQRAAACATFRSNSAVSSAGTRARTVSATVVMQGVPCTSSSVHAAATLRRRGGVWFSRARARAPSQSSCHERRQSAPRGRSCPPAAQSADVRCAAQPRRVSSQRAGSRSEPGHRAPGARRAYSPVRPAGYSP